MKSLLIKDTTKEDRIRIVNQGLSHYLSVVEPVISVTAAIISAEAGWTAILNLILTE